MDWLEKTQDTPLDELQADEEEAAINAAPLPEGAVAMSLVCNECGKKFRNQAAAEFHASKTYVFRPLQQSGDGHGLPSHSALLTHTRTCIASMQISPNQPRRSLP